MEKIRAIPSPRQKKLVQDSFKDLRPFSQAAAELFYKRLFELDPGLRAMFKIDLKEQERKLMDMLYVAVFGLDHLEQLLPALRRLGERHVKYGVTPEMYETLEVALTWMLEQGLEDKFTAEHRAAWETVLQFMVAEMLTGAQG